MKNKTPIFLTVAAAIVFSAGCQTSATNVNTVANATNKLNANTTNQGVNSNGNANAPANASNTSDVGSLATPTDAYKTAHKLRAKKDVEGLKKIMAPDIIEFLTMMGEEENKSLDAMLLDMCSKPQAAKAETRNEKIDGDRATVEYLTETGGWKTMDFQKIGNEWKLGFPKSEPSGNEPKHEL